eukprot:715889-Pelagomonas_calceolata.AAC.3
MGLGLFSFAVGTHVWLTHPASTQSHSLLAALCPMCICAYMSYVQQQLGSNVQQQLGSNMHACAVAGCFAGYFAGAELAVRPQQIAQASELFGILPGLEYATAAQWALERELQVRGGRRCG